MNIFKFLLEAPPWLSFVTILATLIIIFNTYDFIVKLINVILNKDEVEEGTEED